MSVVTPEVKASIIDASEIRAICEKYADVQHLVVNIGV
jgi:hypothetical protein